MNIECRLVPLMIYKVMGGILIYGGNEKMLIFDVVVTTLVSIALVILGVSYPSVKTNMGRGIIVGIMLLYVLCLYGMWF